MGANEQAEDGQVAEVTPRPSPARGKLPWVGLALLLGAGAVVGGREVLARQARTARCADELSGARAAIVRDALQEAQARLDAAEGVCSGEQGDDRVTLVEALGARRRAAASATKATSDARNVAAQASWPGDAADLLRELDAAEVALGRGDRDDVALRVVAVQALLGRYRGTTTASTATWGEIDARAKKLAKGVAPEVKVLSAALEGDRRAGVVVARAGALATTAIGALRRVALATETHDTAAINLLLQDDPAVFALPNAMRVEVVDRGTLGGVPFAHVRVRGTSLALWVLSEALVAP